MVVLSLILILTVAISQERKIEKDTTTVERKADTLALQQSLDLVKLDSIIEKKKKK
mgnify:CR=1 FL=1